MEGDERSREMDVVRGRKPKNQSRVLAFSPDSRLLASAGSDGNLYLWEAATGQEVLRLPGHEAEVSCLAFGPDGRQLFSHGQDGQAYVWDLGPRQGTGLRPALDALWADLS